MYKKILIVFICLFCCGCGKNQETVSKFQKEYEKYNGEYLELTLDKADVVQYSTVNKINKIISSGTGVIFIGSPTDNLSRKVIDILLDVADNTDLKGIYYLDSLDSIDGLDDIQDKKIPVVLFVLKGKIVSYHVGTINDKVDLTDDEVIELYNAYSEGVHKVLEDACDESC